MNKRQPERFYTNRTDDRDCDYGIRSSRDCQHTKTTNKQVLRALSISDGIQLPWAVCIATLGTATGCNPGH